MWPQIFLSLLGFVLWVCTCVCVCESLRRVPGSIWHGLTSVCPGLLYFALLFPVELVWTLAEHDRVCLLAREFARLSVPSAFTPRSIVRNWVILHANDVAPPPFPHHSSSQSFMPCTALRCIDGPSTLPPYWQPFKENTDAWLRMKRIGI